MKKRIGLIIVIVFVAFASCMYWYTDRQKLYTIESKISEELLYKGNSSKWDVKMKIDNGKQIEVEIKYIGIGEPPNLIHIRYEQLNDNITDGVIEFSKTLSGYYSKASMGKITSTNRETLQMVIRWGEREENEEKITIKKINKQNY